MYSLSPNNMILHSGIPNVSIEDKQLQNDCKFLTHIDLLIAAKSLNIFSDLVLKWLGALTVPSDKDGGRCGRDKARETERREEKGERREEGGERRKERGERKEEKGERKEEEGERREERGGRREERGEKREEGGERRILRERGERREERRERREERGGMKSSKQQQCN